MLFYEVEAEALALLGAMKECHEQHNPDAPFSQGTLLAPEHDGRARWARPGLTSLREGCGTSREGRGVGVGRTRWHGAGGGLLPDYPAGAGVARATLASALPCSPK